MTAAPPSSSSADPIDLNRFWLSPSASSSSQLASIRKRLPGFPSPVLRVSRVGQLDASLLDNELESILAGPIWKALELLRLPGQRNWEPEMMAVLRLAVLKMSLYERGATYGAELQNLKYRNEWQHQRNGLQSTAHDSRLAPAQKIAYIALSVLPSYLSARMRDRMLASSWADEPLPRSWFSLVDLRRRRTDEGRDGMRREWKRIGWEGIRLVEKLGAMMDLVNFLVFLYDGRYRTVIDRMLGMRLIYAQRSVSRNVSFEFLNRQLVWEAFTEFLLFLMPLVNLYRLRLKIVRFLSTTASSSKPIALLLSLLPSSLLKALKLPHSLKSAGSKEAGKPEKVAEKQQGAMHFLSSATCPICYEASSSTDSPSVVVPASPSTSITTLTSTPTATVAAMSAIDSVFPSSNTSPNLLTPTPAVASDSNHPVQVPYITNCGNGCRYCYYCVVSALARCEEEGESAWTCLRCGDEVTGVTREVPVLVEEENDDRDDSGEEEEEEEDGEAESSQE